VIRAFLRAPSGLLGLAGLAILLLVCLVAPALFATRAREFDVFAAAQQPSAAHFLGTDALGRDILLRLLVATPTSLGMALAATIIGTVLGTTIGAVAVILPGRARTAVLRTIDALIAFPFIIVAIFLTAIIGASALGSILGVGVSSSFGKARVTSSLVMAIAGRDFVSAARVVGVSPRRVVLRYLLPNIGETLALTTTISISSSILAVSSLSFLGLGIQPPEYDWGRMLTDGVNSFYATPLAAIAPATIIAMSALAFGFVGEALARAFNPTLWTVIEAARSGKTPARALATNDDSIEVVAARNLRASIGKNGGREILEVKDLSVHFPGPRGPVAVVDKISFSIAKGDMVGVVGESGSGKTMTSLAIAQLVPYPGKVTGTIRLDGKDLHEISGSALRRLLGTQVANVFQDPMSSLNPALTIGTQMTEGVEEHRGVSHRVSMAAALDGLREVNIPIPERQVLKHPHELSGGMRQRVMIAMGLMNKPDLLIADEPTTALDVTIQAQIMELLAQINAKRQISTILISHNIALVSQNCQRALVMYGGRIVEDLTIQQLKEQPMHPYTRALIGSIPDMSRPREAELTTIPGQAADTANLPTGCAYHPRCPLAIARCSVDVPPLLARPDGRRVACWVANADIS
jgi:peptide/nickel transport system ATP-binding protein/peptide/nickel transport system permease protein